MAFTALGGPRLVRYLALNLMNSLPGAWLLSTFSPIVGSMPSHAIRLVLVDVHLVGDKERLPDDVDPPTHQPRAF